MWGTRERVSLVYPRCGAVENRHIESSHVQHGPPLLFYSLQFGMRAQGYPETVVHLSLLALLVSTLLNIVNGSGPSLCGFQRCLRNHPEIQDTHRDQTDTSYTQCYWRGREVSQIVRRAYSEVARLSGGLQFYLHNVWKGFTKCPSLQNLSPAPPPHRCPFPKLLLKLSSW